MDKKGGGVKLPRGGFLGRKGGYWVGGRGTRVLSIWKEGGGRRLSSRKKRFPWPKGKNLSVHKKGVRGHLEGGRGRWLSKENGCRLYL